MDSRELPLWKARTQALTFLGRERSAQFEVIGKLFMLADDCIDAYELQEDDLYSVMCGLTTLKAKNLAHVLLKVMNTHYGPPDELPFDLRHRRWPVKYRICCA